MKLSFFCSGMLYCGFECEEVICWLDAEEIVVNYEVESGQLLIFGWHEMNCRAEFKRVVCGMDVAVERKWYSMECWGCVYSCDLHRI